MAGRQVEASLVTAGGVFVPAHLTEPLWRVLRAWIQQHQRDGGRIRPELLQLVDVLRQAALDHLADAGGHEPRTPADIGAPSAASAGLPVPTSTLADRLGVTERHARRLARVEGIAPIRRNRWAAEDVAALVTRRHA